MLDGSVTIDHRLLTEAGRKEIIKEQKDLPENFRQSTENLAQALPDGEYKDKVLQTLNNIQAKLYNLPSEYKEAGVVGNQVASELLKRGIEPAEVEALFSHSNIFEATKEFSEIKSQLERLAKSGLDLETIFKQAVYGSSVQETIYAQGTDFETEVTQASTLGMVVLRNLADLGNNISQISKDTGVDLGTVQLAIGVIISGPVRVAIEAGKSLALDSLVGDKIADGFDALATSLVASAHLTTSNTVRNWTNNENIDVIINSNSENKEDELDFAFDLVKKKQGAEYLINAAAGVVGVGSIGGKSNTTKIDGKDVEVSTAGVGSRGELTKPYDPNQTRNDLEAVYGKENVKSTTVSNNPYQRVNSNKEKGIEVISDSYGNKAVKVEYKDPLTGETKFANAAYDDRKLPVFDDYAKYTTKIQKPDGYENMSSDKRRREEMKLATQDIKKQIQSGKISKNGFTPQQLAAINAGSDTIPGYTWHHNAQSKPNNFQLLPREIHDAIKHIGEASLSGGK